MQGFFAAQGLHGFLAAQGFFAAQGFLAAQGFFAAQGLHGFLAAQGLQGFLWPFASAIVPLARSNEATARPRNIALRVFIGVHPPEIG